MLGGNFLEEGPSLPTLVPPFLPRGVSRILDQVLNLLFTGKGRVTRHVSRPTPLSYGHFSISSRRMKKRGNALMLIDCIDDNTYRFASIHGIGIQLYHTLGIATALTCYVLNLKGCDEELRIGKAFQGINIS